MIRDKRRWRTRESLPESNYHVEAGKLFSPGRPRAVGAGEALAQESREPTAVRRLKVGNDVDISAGSVAIPLRTSTLVPPGQRELQHTKSRRLRRARSSAGNREVAEGERSEDLRGLK